MTTTAALYHVHYPGMAGTSTPIVVTREDIMEAVKEVSGMSTTEDELQEIMARIRKAVFGESLVAMVEDALARLAYGGGQVRLARAGGYPCEGCADCYLDHDGSCRNENRCRAWDIYSNQY